MITGAFTPILIPQDSTAMSYESTSFPRHALELSFISEIEEEGTWSSLGRDLSRCPGTQFCFQHQFPSLHQKKPGQDVAQCPLMPFGLSLDVYKKCFISFWAGTFSIYSAHSSLSLPCPQTELETNIISPELCTQQRAQSNPKT